MSSSSSDENKRVKFDSVIMGGPKRVNSVPTRRSRSHSRSTRSEVPPDEETSSDESSLPIMRRRKRRPEGNNHGKSKNPGKRTLASRSFSLYNSDMPFKIDSEESSSALFYDVESDHYYDEDMYISDSDESEHWSSSFSEEYDNEDTRLDNLYLSRKITRRNIRINTARNSKKTDIRETRASRNGSNWSFKREKSHKNMEKSRTQLFTKRRYFRHNLLEESGDYTAHQIRMDNKNDEKKRAYDYPSFCITKHVQLNYEIVQNILKNCIGRHQEVSLAYEYLDLYLCWVKPSKLNDIKADIAANPVVYLLLWRVLWTYCEQISFSATRLAELFQLQTLFRNEGQRGPIYELCDCFIKGEKTGDLIDINIEDFHRGIEEIKQAKINFDDLYEIHERYKKSNTIIKERSLKKTYFEPEGIATLPVMINHYFAMLQINLFVVLVTWWLWNPDSFPLILFVQFDASLLCVSILLDVLARSVTYGLRNSFLGYFHLPMWMGIYRLFFVFFVISYIVYSMFLLNFSEFFQKIFFGTGVFIRCLYNLVLFYYPANRFVGHHTQKRDALIDRIKHGSKLFLFFVANVGLLIPMFYFFVIPTLDGAKFWSFCSKYKYVDTAYYQCIVGLGSLWIPIIATLLVINYLMFTIVMGVFGTSIAYLKGTGLFKGEIFTPYRALRVLGVLLKGWNVVIDNDKENDSVAQGPAMMISRVNTRVLRVELTENKALDRILRFMLQDLYENDLINYKEMKRIEQHPAVKIDELSTQAANIISFFMKSLATLSDKKIQTVIAKNEFCVEFPSLSQLIPCYAEVVFFDRSYLVNRRGKRVSNIEFLVAKFNSEWDNFTQRMIRKYDNCEVPEEPEEFLRSYMENTMNEQLSEEVCVWASMRGQTIYRTVRGALCYKQALKILFKYSRHANFVRDKYQIIIAHQKYGDPATLESLADDVKALIRKTTTQYIAVHHEEDLIKKQNSAFEDMLTFDLVFDYSRDVVRGPAQAFEDAYDLADPKLREAVFNDANSKLLYAYHLSSQIRDNITRGYDKQLSDVILRNMEYASIRAKYPLITSTIHDVIVMSCEEDYEHEQTWKFETFGPAALHRDGWLRSYDMATGRECSVTLFGHCNKVELIQCADYEEEEDIVPENFYGIRIQVVLDFITDEPKTINYVILAPRVQMTWDEERGPRLKPEHIEYYQSMLPDVEIVRGDNINPNRFFGSLIAACLNDQNKEFDLVRDGIHLGLEVTDVIPRQNPLLLNVAGDMPFSQNMRIQGKACNQRNGLLFAHGNVIQTKDANQGGTLFEAIKVPIILHRFVAKTNDIPGRSNKDEKDKQSAHTRPVIIGFREEVFTHRQGTVARLMGYSEWSFGTIVQRTLGKLGLRMHYGHPDFFWAPWVFSRSSLSKASARYNLSEDVFAGFYAFQSGRRSLHTDRIQDEKGRDTSLSSTYTFQAKLAQGCASILKTRDIFEIASRIDAIRLYLFLQSSFGYFITSVIMLSAVKMYLFGIMMFTISGFSAENLENLEIAFSVPWLFQLGNFLMIPLLLETYVERGLWATLRVILDIPLSIIYFIFQGQTTFYHFVESFLNGKSKYQPTGRKLGITRKSLIENFKQYGHSHYYPAFDYILYMIIYLLLASSRSSGLLVPFSPVIVVMSFLFAPIVFNTVLNYKTVKRELEEFGNWVFNSAPLQILIRERDRINTHRKLFDDSSILTSSQRLQSYNIMENLETEVNTGYWVDISKCILSCTFFLFWMGIALSIPGQSKDITLQVGVLLLVYSLYVLMSEVIPSNNRNWQVFTYVLWASAVFFVIFSVFVWKLYYHIDTALVGLFISYKIINNFVFFIFYVYATVVKYKAAKLIKSADTSHTKKMVAQHLDRRLIKGLFMVDITERPFTLFSIGVFLLPVHLILNIILLIPHLSDYLLYDTKIKALDMENVGTFNNFDPMNFFLNAMDNYEVRNNMNM
eukprot:TRINITY_DN2971_c0_g1_i1.p1 TRINITY_DN2971_c0_g1~~TRINITY_DN2971_c0_g1_i1.p1  ORF type:complete len:1946 (-),score=334.56 TRINITY_DN2971_c0_g1_i1:891-6728(-)